MSRALGALWLALVSGLGADSPLADALQRGDLTRAESLWGQVADLNAAQVDGTTALHWAIYRDETVWAQRLIQAGADITVTNRYAVSPIYLASFNGNARIIEALMAQGIDPDAVREGGETALMTAARTGNVAAVKALVAAGADIDAKLPRGQTALMWATAEGHLGVVSYLIAAGADFTGAVVSGFTPAMFAVREGHGDLVELFLDHGIDVNSTIEPTGERGYKPPARHSSLLIMAIENGHFALAVELLEAGADPNDQRSEFAPLHTLTWVRRPDLGDGASGDPVPIGRGNLTSMDMARALVEYGADVNLALIHGEARAGGAHLPNLGNTPFMLACHTGDIEFANFLLEQGADPMQGNADGTTPFLAAAGVGRHAPEEEAGTEEEALTLLALLLDLGADVNQRDYNDESAMHGAAYANFPLVLAFLVEQGADVAIWNQPNDRGRTPLDLADGYRPGNFKPSAITSQAVTRLMLAAGVTPNTEGRTIQNQYN